MHRSVTFQRLFLTALAFCAGFFLMHGSARAASNCGTNNFVSGGVSKTVNLSSSFQPPALAPGGQVTATISGNCKNLTSASVNIKLGNGTYFSGGFGYRGVFCTLCAGPSPYNAVYYQIYESDGVTPFPAAGLNVACTGNCTGGSGGTYTYTVIFQIVTPSAATSLNDAQIGSYTDTALVATITGSGDNSPATYNNTVNATVTQDCVLAITSNVGFGAYSPLTVTAATTANGGLSITCTRGSSGITLVVGAGDNSSHATAPSTRAMVGASHGDYLSYDIFEDSGYGTRYPTSAVAETISGGITSPSSIALYGQIPLPAQNVSADSYSDSVLTTVNF